MWNTQPNATRFNLCFSTQPNQPQHKPDANDADVPPDTWEYKNILEHHIDPSLDILVLWTWIRPCVQGIFIHTCTAQFQYQKENRQAANLSILSLRGPWLAAWRVFFLVLKLRSTCEKHHPVCKIPNNRWTTIIAWIPLTTMQLKRLRHGVWIFSTFLTL